jgi:hypothetical protein
MPSCVACNPGPAGNGLSRLLAAAESAVWPGAGLPGGCGAQAYDWRILAGLDVLLKVPTPCNGERLRRLLAELIACKPRRLIVLRNHAPHVQFIVSAARGVEVQP